jgi:arsenate reductase-like glutaredoxin family protein
MFNGKNKALTFSYDDGVPQDKKLAELFHKYGLKATFNFNSTTFRKENYTKEQIEDTVMKLIQKWHKNREKENER